MEKLNLPPFYVGQRIVCLISDRVAKKGLKYTAKSVVKCPYCEEWLIGYAEAGMTGWVSCTHSDKSVISTTGLFHAPHTNFAPIQESKFRAVTLEKLCEEVELICEN